MLDKEQKSDLKWLLKFIVFVGIGLFILASQP